MYDIYVNVQFMFTEVFLMSKDTVKHRLKVFISSKCGGRYSIVRKALEKMLDETGMIECYCFETEPASAESLPSAYLNRIQECKLFLLIIDNSEPAKTAVMSEYQKAKELGLKIIAIFCDETEKEKTDIEKEIISSGMAKYLPVHEFSDITFNAYQSVMQDLVNAYGVNPTIVNTQINIKEIPSPYDIAFKKDDLAEFVATVQLICGIDDDVSTTAEITPADDAFKKFWNVVINNTPFDDTLFTNVRNAILERHKEEKTEIFEHRLNALENYYKGDIDQCIVELKTALRLFDDSQNQDNWLKNDIAIDLRNMIRKKDTMNGRFSVVNEGQQRLDSSDSFTCFPVLDRLANNIESELLKECNRINRESPYTMHFSDSKYIYSNISSYYCTALLYGSITHLNIIKSYMRDIAEVYVQEYPCLSITSEYIRLLVLEANDKKIDELLRTYCASSHIVDEHILERCLQCICYLPYEYDQIKAKMQLLNRFGYYLSADQFSNLITWLLKYVSKWSANKQRNMYMFKDIQDVFKHCAERISPEKLAKMIITLFNSNNTRLFDMACSFINNLRVDSLSEEMQQKIYNHLVKKVKDKNMQHSTYLRTALVLFAKQTKLNLDNLNTAIATYMSDFYNTDYNIDVIAKDKRTLLQHISQYLDRIHTKTVNGDQGYHIGGADPFEIIDAVIQIHNLKLTAEEWKSIIKASAVFLLSKEQYCTEKCSAISLLITVATKCNSKKITDYIFSEINDRDQILNCVQVHGFDINTRVLAILFDLLSVLCDHAANYEFISSLSAIHTLSDNEIIFALRALHDNIRKIEPTNIPKDVVFAITQLARSFSKNKEHDIRLYSVYCMIDLLKCDFEDYVLSGLSYVMDIDSSDIRIAIVHEMKNINQTNALRSYIIQKAKVDNHYLVRKIAKEITA